MKRLKVQISLPFYHAQASFNHYVSVITQIEPLHRAGYDVMLQPLVGDVIDRQRNCLVACARYTKCDVVVMCDVDTGFEGLDLVRMIESGLPVVGVNYPRRDYAFGPNLNGDYETAEELRDSLLKPTIGTKDNPRTKNGMTEVLYVGTGFKVVRMEVYDAIAAKGLAEKYERPCKEEWQPYLYEWYKFPITQPGHILGPGLKLGEDWQYCDLARAAGYDVWCYPNAVCSHSGLHTFHGKVKWPEPLDGAKVQGIMKERIAELLQRSRGVKEAVAATTI